MGDKRYEPQSATPTELDLHRRHVLALGAAAGLGLATSSTAAAAAGEEKDDHAPGEENDDHVAANGMYLAAMTGDQQPGQVETAATGGALFSLNEEGYELEYAVLVNAIENADQAHIHLGPEGEEGPVAAWLYPDPAATEPELLEGRFDGILATGTITEEDLAETVEGGTMSALVEEIEAGNAYVNVHTEEHPAGEIRGQIVSVEDVAAALMDEDVLDDEPDEELEEDEELDDEEPDDEDDAEFDDDEDDDEPDDEEPKDSDEPGDADNESVDGDEKNDS